MSLTLEDFQAYAQIKAYDVLSAGNFKRHLSQSRDSGEKWAIIMYNRQMLIQNRLREISTLVSQLNMPSSTQIQRICKDVMTCAQPPIKVLTGYNTCCLTGAKVEHCIDLTRVGKNSKEVHVHPRFWHFFVLLWFCAKLEYVIRACTKQWLDRQGVKPNAATYTQLCEDFSEQNPELITQLHRLFDKGAQYILNSLAIYRDKYAIRPVLMPSKEFLEGGTHQ